MRQLHLSDQINVLFETASKGSPILATALIRTGRWCRGAEPVLEYAHVQVTGTDTRIATDSSGCSWGFKREAPLNF